MMSTSQIQFPKIMDYLNYREYLKDLLLVHKNLKTHLTQKFILSELQINSTGFISNLYSGKKNLSPIHVTRLTKALNLTPSEKDYFELLVNYNQAKEFEAQSEFFQKLMEIQNAQLKILDPLQHSIFSKWYYVYVRELISFFPVKHGYKQLAQMLTPAISEEEAKEAVDVLIELNFLRRQSNGFLEQCEPSYSTGDEVRSIDLRNFQLQTIENAKKALIEIPMEERDISVLSLSLSEQGFSQLKKEMQYFRKKIARIAMAEEDANRVYQVNLQLFPVSKVRKAK